MKNKQTRTYNSLVRQKQAEDTKNRIADAAEKLITTNGYEQTTINEIAKKAGVATQTVYAIFNSKQGILMYLLKRGIEAADARVDYQSLIKLNRAEDVAQSLAAMLGKQSKEHMSIFNALGGLDRLYPEMAEMVKEANEHRRQEIIAGFNLAADERRFDLTLEQKKYLTDIIWTFTDSSLYYMLVEYSHWPYELYELLLKKVLESLITDIAPEMLQTLHPKADDDE